MNKTIHNVICLMVVLTLCSCAHKTGHIKKKISQGRSVVTIQNDNDQNVAYEGKGNKKENEIANSRSQNKLDGAEIFEKYGNAVFMVFTSDGKKGFQGSGFFVDNNGLAVSNYHVFKGTAIGNEQIKLLNDNTAYKVTDIICKSNDPTFQESDFIVFRVDCKDTNYIPIAKNQPKIGEKVYAIGSPLGLENTLSSGEVSGKRGEDLLQISVPIDHGSSGGALINEYGEVVGITSSGMDSQANLNFAWSIDVIKPYLK